MSLGSPENTPAPGQEPAEQVVRELSHDLMSPYCPGRTIASCPSGQARKLEEEILQEARDGKTREEIEAQLVERFGRDIQGYIGRPELIYGSVAVALIAIVLLFRLGRQWVRRDRVGAPTPTPDGGSRTPSDDELDRVEDELDELDEF